jgi:hypothetical protein
MLMSGAKHAGHDPSHRAKYGATTQALQLYEFLQLYDVKDKEYKTDVDAGVYGFTAATQMVFGRFGMGAWDLLRSMAERAEQEGRVCKETFALLLHVVALVCCIVPWQLLGAKERLA